jgi:gamma-glutamyltranspeptidase/glutathione hydrolase
MNTNPTILLLISILLVAVSSSTGMSDTATGSSGAVATVHSIATDAGMAVLNSGGNALDAAVAAALMLGVVDSHNSGLGGGCFILIHAPDENIICIDGRETAPALAHRDMYMRNGLVDVELSQTGPLAVAIPGALAAYELALKRCGTHELSELLRPAAVVAQSGYPIDRVMARNIYENVAAIRLFPATAQILLDSMQQPWHEDHVLVQTDLAKTYSAIAEHGTDWFYRGPFAEQAGKWMGQNDGIATATDFAEYRSIEREPVVTTYRGHTVYGFPPPSSGGIHVAQILNILENFDVRAIHADDPVQFIHLVSEAMKLAFADRAFWLGDADFARVPRGLVDKRYAAQLAQRIDLDRAVSVPNHGLPPDWEDSVYGKHTTHISAADSDGMFVAITATVNTSFGSKVMIPGTGLALNNEMDDFSSQPGTPNVFGLVGAENNSIEPGKRPLSSMSPTIIVKDGRPIMTVGAAGGPKIITATVLAIIRRLDLELPIQDAVRSARFHHQWKPDVLFVESNLSDRVVQSLTNKNHSVERLTSAGVLQAIVRNDDGTFTAVSDHRVPGKAGAK